MSPEMTAWQIACKNLWDLRLLLSLSVYFGFILCTAKKMVKTRNILIMTVDRTKLQKLLKGKNLILKDYHYLFIFIIHILLFYFSIYFKCKLLRYSFADSIPWVRFCFSASRKKTKRKTLAGTAGASLAICCVCFFSMLFLFLLFHPIPLAMVNFLINQRTFFVQYRCVSWLLVCRLSKKEAELMQKWWVEICQAYLLPSFNGPAANRGGGGCTLEFSGSTGIRIRSWNSRRAQTNRRWNLSLFVPLLFSLLLLSSRQFYA